MKTFAIIATTVILSFNTFAADNAGAGQAGAGQAGAGQAGAGHGTTGKDWSHKRQEQVAQIFPGFEVNKAAVIKPEKVQLVAPAFLAKVTGQTVKLEWTAAGGAQNYHVQVSKDAGFNNRSMYVAEDKFVSGTSFEVSQLEPGVKYFWRVAAHNKNQDAMYTKSLFVSSVFETSGQ